METDITERERNLLIALAWMCDQWCDRGNDQLDHGCMSAHQAAVQQLMKFGLVEPVDPANPLGRSSRWTATGREYRIDRLEWPV
jgi:hypothetical protein